MTRPTQTPTGNRFDRNFYRTIAVILLMLTAASFAVTLVDDDINGVTLISYVLYVPTVLLLLRGVRKPGSTSSGVDNIATGGILYLFATVLAMISINP